MLRAIRKCSHNGICELIKSIEGTLFNQGAFFVVLPNSNGLY